MNKIGLLFPQCTAYAASCVQITEWSSCMIMAISVFNINRDHGFVVFTFFFWWENCCPQIISSYIHFSPPSFLSRCLASYLDFIYCWSLGFSIKLEIQLSTFINGPETFKVTWITGQKTENEVWELRSVVVTTVHSQKWVKTI